MVPMVIVVGVTPTSEAVLPAPPLRDEPLPAPEPPAPLPVPEPPDGSAPAPFPPPGTTPPPGPMLAPGNGSPEGPVATAPAACCCACTNALSGSRVPQADSTRVDPAMTHTAGLLRTARFSHLPLSADAPRRGRTGRAAVPCRARRRTTPARTPVAQPAPVGRHRLAAARPGVVPRHLTGDGTQQLPGGCFDGVDARGPGG